MDYLPTWKVNKWPHEQRGKGYRQIFPSHGASRIRFRPFWGLPKFHSKLDVNNHFRYLKWRVSWTLFSAILMVGFPLHKPYPYSLYRWGFLHFRYLKCLVKMLLPLPIELNESLVGDPYYSWFMIFCMRFPYAHCSLLQVVLVFRFWVPKHRT